MHAKLSLLQRLLLCQLVLDSLGKCALSSERISSIKEADYAIDSRNEFDRGRAAVLKGNSYTPATFKKLTAVSPRVKPLETPDATK